MYNIHYNVCSLCRYYSTCTSWRRRGLKRVPRSNLDQLIQRAFHQLELVQTSGVRRVEHRLKSSTLRVFASFARLTQVSLTTLQSLRHFWMYCGCTIITILERYFFLSFNCISTMAIVNLRIFEKEHISQENFGRSVLKYNHRLYCNRDYKSLEWLLTLYYKTFL